MVSEKPPDGPPSLVDWIWCECGDLRLILRILVEVFVCVCVLLHFGFSIVRLDFMIGALGFPWVLCLRVVQLTSYFQSSVSICT